MGEAQRVVEQLRLIGLPGRFQSRMQHGSDVPDLGVSARQAEKRDEAVRQAVERHRLDWVRSFDEHVRSHDC